MTSPSKSVETGEEASEDQRSTEEPPSRMFLNILAQPLGTTANYEEEDEDELAEGLFSLDEEQPNIDTGKISTKYNEYESDDAEDESDAVSVTDAVRNTHSRTDTHTGALAYGTSLPVTIPTGRFWPPRDAVDSIRDREGLLSSDDENGEDRAKTVLPQRVHKDLYREMRAQARSIQAADDPERLFGERPQRRRYQTGETSTIPRPVASHEKTAVVIVAASVAGRL